MLDFQSRNKLFWPILIPNWRMKMRYFRTTFYLNHWRNMYIDVPLELNKKPCVLGRVCEWEKFENLIFLNWDVEVVLFKCVAWSSRSYRTLYLLDYRTWKWVRRCTRDGHLNFALSGECSKCLWSVYVPCFLAWMKCLLGWDTCPWIAIAWVRMHLLILDPSWLDPWYLY